jgi:hypothetical protein
MPIGLFHRFKNSFDMSPRNPLMEEVAHRINEDHTRPLPAEWLRQPFGPKRKIKAGLEWMTRHPAKPF